MRPRVSGVDNDLSLAWLLSPLPVETFLHDIWGATHHHVKRSCPGYFDDLLDGSTAVEALLELFQCEPGPAWAMRLVRPGEKRHADTYRRADGSLDLVRVHDDFAGGYTIVLDGVEQYVRAIASLTHSIEVELNFATKVNAYITPPGSQGFAAHYDEHDVLILQIQGSKVWHVYDGADVSPHDMHRREPVKAAGLPTPTDLCLDVGDVLYLPRGRVHAAETTSEPSVHLTVGIHAPTLLTLVTQALYSLSRTDDRVHTQLPPRHLDDAEVRASVSMLVRDVARALEEPDVIGEVLGGLEDVLVKRGRCPPVGRAVADAAGIDEHTSVVKYQPLYARVTAAGDGVALHFAQLVINAGPDHHAALSFVAKSTEPFRVCDLPGLSAAQQTELARTLITSGFLVRLPDD
ncbi:cupin domain-containing protein [Mycobacterium sp.]|uniref:cupin domain-containing protein n=1 Tax=Mycobacterium sp. TaxID=1785 RepID=UPI00128325E2|nr:cupin domain-containing protein [Mycobacterium sp.]KAA8960761.1 MAG: cupin [Mycobacterium sp.]